MALQANCRFELKGCSRMQLQKTEYLMYLRISMDIYIHDCMINDTTSTGDVLQRPKIWTMSTAFHHIRGILDTGDRGILIIHGISWYLLSQHFSTYYSMYYNLLLKISLLLSCCSILLDSAGECPPIPTFPWKYFHFKTSSLQATSAPLGLSLWAKF